MLLLDKSVFFHTPKTGGQWVIIATYAAGVQGRNHVEGGHQTPAEMLATSLKTDIESRFRFSFVRSPVAWFQSFWMYRQRVGDQKLPQWRLGEPICNLGDLGFDEFVEYVCVNHPGLLSKTFNAFTEGSDFIGKTETIYEDTVNALRQAGEVFHEHVVRSLAKYNTKGPDQERPTYSKQSLKLLWDSEREAFEKYGYSKPY